MVIRNRRVGSASRLPYRTAKETVWSEIGGKERITYGTAAVAVLNRTACGCGASTMVLAGVCR